MELKTILIVEDNPEDIVLYKRYLKKILQPETIIDMTYAEEALKYTLKEHVDCILLDYQLPDMCGVDFIEKLNQSVLDVKPPIVMLTGSGNENVAVQALKAGAADYIIKGEITADNLSRSIQNAIDKTALLRQVKAQEKALKEMAYNDFLTGIPNRVRFEELANQSLARSDRHYQHTAILMVDLDGFKAVNDSYGHDAGDELLKKITERFKNTIRKNDTVARLGGDEFALILENINIDQLEVIASKLILESEKPIKINDNEVAISSSIGISIYPSDGKNLKELLKKADLALYKAKDNGKGQFIKYQDY